MPCVDITGKEMPIITSVECSETGETHHDHCYKAYFPSTKFTDYMMMDEVVPGMTDKGTFKCHLDQKFQRVSVVVELPDKDEHPDYHIVQKLYIYIYIYIYILSQSIYSVNLTVHRRRFLRFLLIYRQDFTSWIWTIARILSSIPKMVNHPNA